ncbi:hypothetical protein J6590_056416 [Homalodisca vitripennis]|nr:hypothetical protein J6590_056416 [Homalodisca vitripennis]
MVRRCYPPRTKLPKSVTPLGAAPHMTEYVVIHERFRKRTKTYTLLCIKFKDRFD